MLHHMRGLIECDHAVAANYLTQFCRLFNPQSFLTAVKQTTARRNEWPLDRTVIVTEVRIIL